MKIFKHKIKTILNASLIAGLTVSMFSCTKNFEDLNTNGNKITDEMLEADMLAVGAFIGKMQQDIIPASDKDANEFQRAQNLTGDIFSGYMAAIGQWGSSVNNSTYYLHYDNWNNVGFNVAYSSVLSAWSQITTRGTKLGLKDAVAFADIHKVMSLHRITDNYGPIPYSKAGQGSLGAEYDAQEDVYKQMFADLDNAITVLTDFAQKSPTARPLRKFDLIYEGDYSMWVKLANTLKLRLAMRIVYVDPTNARKYAEEAVNHPFGVISSNAENAFVKSHNGISVSHPLEICWNSYADTRVGASLEAYLKGYNDPRIAAYMQPAANGGYHGVRNGLIIRNKGIYLPMSAPKVLTSTPIQLMVASEAYFLRAEGAIRGWNMGGSAKDLYETGVKTSFEQHGFVAESATYLADATAKQADFVDVAGSDGISSVSNITIAWEEAAGLEKKLERIITQKWIAMYPEGQEAWTEMRRTGYPRIFPIVSNKSNSIVSTVDGVRRIPFPKDEYDANKDNVTKAINLLGGADNGATKLWWDKK